MKGYTLIEILVGLAIIGLLFSFGFVSFRDYSRRQALAGAVKEVQGDLRLAQEDASAGLKPDDINCNYDPITLAGRFLNGYDFTVLSQSDPAEYEIRASCSGGNAASPTKDVTLASGITISVPSPTPILFKVLGQGTNIPGGTSAVITLSLIGLTDTATVTIGSGGEIQ
jgi:prepilin-type N-terminal cleavage/methylation domain-containing protein